MAALRLGTRGSALALAQAQLVAEALGGAELVPIKTTGDGKGPGGDKARFVREIEQALLAGQVDLAVHSAKDLPVELPEGLEIAAVPEREDPRDAFAGAAGSLEVLPEGARVGTSSLRRRAQLLALRPDIAVEPIHGNVDTRLSKLAEGELEGIVLAAAGLLRLGRESEASFIFTGDAMLPAAGQGFLAVEARSDNAAALEAARGVSDDVGFARLACERAAVSALGAGCDTPVGAIARIDSGRMRVRGFCGLPDGSEWIRDEADADPDDPAAAGALLAERMQGAGAGDLLARAEKMTAALGLAK